MSSAEDIANIFDKAKMITIETADLLTAERARNADLEALLRATEEERDRERRDRLVLTKEYSALEERARKLERDNAVLHSQGEQIVAIWKSGGERIAESSDLRPEQIQHPRIAADDELENEFRKIGEELQKKRGYVEKLTEQDGISHTADRSGLAEAATQSSEAEPR